MEGWINWVMSKYGLKDTSVLEIFLKHAFAHDIIKEYAVRYGEDLDGWFFHHAKYADKESLAKIARESNRNTVLAFHDRSRSLLEVESPGLEDFSSGYPMSLKLYAPYDNINEKMLDIIEYTGDGYLRRRNEMSLGHIYMPINRDNWSGVKLSNSWENSKDAMNKANEWFTRALASNGAWTWGVGREGNDPYSYYLIDQEHLDFIGTVEFQSWFSIEGNELEKEWPDCVGMIESDCEKLIEDEMKGALKAEVVKQPAKGENGYNAVIVGMGSTGNILGVTFGQQNWDGNKTGSIKLDFSDSYCSFVADADDCCELVLTDPRVFDNPDDLGNEIECFPSYQVGTLHDRKNNRVQIRVDENGVVLMPPRVG